MKTALLLAVLSATTLCTNAQNLDPIRFNDIVGDNPNGVHNYHIMKGDDITPLAMQQRCVSYALRVDQQGLADSLRFVYSGNRHSVPVKMGSGFTAYSDTNYRVDLSDNSLVKNSDNQYDNQDRWIGGNYYYYGQIVGTRTGQYNGSVQVLYEDDYDHVGLYKYFRKVQYNNDGMVLYDTTYVNHYNQSPSNRLQAQEFTYDNLGRRVTVRTFSSDNNYTNSNSILRKSFYNGNATIPFMDSIIYELSSISTQILFTYDAQNRLIEERHFNQNFSHPYFKAEITYAGSTKTTISKNWDGTSWQNNSKIIETVNADGNPTEYQSFNGVQNSTVWEPYYTIDREYNNAGYLTKLLVYSVSNGNLYLSEQQLITRNSYNNATVNIITYYDASQTIVQTQQHNYYYDEFDDGLAIKNKANEINVSIYPNPSMGLLNINIAETQSLGLRLNVYDINGSLVMNKSLNNGLNNVSIVGLASGNYIVEVINSKQNGVFRKTIIKN